MRNRTASRLGAGLLFLMFSAVMSAQPVARELASPAGSGATEPFLAPARGGLLLSWIEPVPKSGRAALRFARFSRGQWSSPRTIIERNDLFLNWADLPSVVEDARGTLFAHWLQRSGGETYAYDVRMATSADGGRSWSASFLLNRDGKKNEHGFVSLTPLPAGGVGAVWLDGRNMPEGKEEGEMTLRYAAIDRRGGIHSEVQLDARTCECCTTGMAMAAKGPVIVYRDRSPEEIRDIAVVRAKGTKWSSPQLLHADGWKIAGCPVNGPQIAATGNHLAAAWFTGAGDHGRVYVAFSDDGGATFGPPIGVDDGTPVGRVDVVLIDEGSAVVTWSEQTAAGAEIRARRVSESGTRGAAVKVADSATARAAGFVRAASRGRDVYFAWTGQGPSGKSVHVARATF